MNIGMESCGPNPRTHSKAEYDAMAGELDRVSRELSCLQSVIAEPDELNAEPASDYETLRRQYLSLRLLTNSALARNRYLCRRDDRDMRAALSVNAANVSAERDTNAMLTDLLEKAEAERDALHAEDEALRAENGRLNAQFNECARLFVDATEQACEAQRVRDALAVELEAARGLLQHLASVMAGHDQAPEEYNALAAARDFTATPAPEVRAEQEERQEAVAWSLRLPDGRTTLEKAYPKWAEGGDGYAIQPLYTTPQPVPDLRALVEALEKIEIRADAFIEDERDMPIHSVEMVSEIAKRALATYRQDTQPCPTP